MKKLLLIFCLVCIGNSISQSKNEIKTLDYANIEVEIPTNCTAKSNYELLDCDGVSVQWIYLTEAMLKSAPKKLIKEFSKNTKTKEQIEVVSFGATLKGYKFTYKNPENWNRIIVYGIVNKQPLILNVASEDELIAISGTNEFLKKIIKIKS